MRYSSIKISTGRMLPPDEAGNYVGFPALLEKMVAAGWVTPIKKSKPHLYDLNKLDQCCDRLSAG